MDEKRISLVNYQNSSAEKWLKQFCYDLQGAKDNRKNNTDDSSTSVSLFNNHLPP